jgi:predicted ATPase
VIATHSPLLLAYPEATIYELNESGIERVSYEETDSYRLTRAFLENTEGFLHHLFS